jgi:uncharacterized C2H2 Zn-finger protein
MEVCGLRRVCVATRKDLSEVRCAGTSARRHVSDARCPRCGEEIARQHDTEAGALFLRCKSLIVRTDPPSTVLTCPGCDAPLEVRKGRLLIFPRLSRAGSAP